MKRLMTFVGLAAALVAGVSQASELDTLQRKLARYVAYGGTFKAACVCQDGGANHGKAGYVTRSSSNPVPGLTEVQTFCSVSAYTFSGYSTGNVLCNPFVPLAK